MLVYHHRLVLCCVSEFICYINVQAICADSEASSRVLKSYMMMLDFYGMKLNEHTGE